MTIQDNALSIYPEYVVTLSELEDHGWASPDEWLAPDYPNERWQPDTCVVFMPRQDDPGTWDLSFRHDGFVDGIEPGPYTRDDIPGAEQQAMTGTGFRKMRRWLDLTQADLAVRLGCSESYIHKMEGGHRNVRAVYVLAMERLLSLAGVEVA